MTMSQTRHYEMKDSGVEWIGKMPSNWQVKYLFQLVSQVKNKNNGLREKNLLSLSYGKIKRKDIETTDGLLPASFDGYNIIEEGDIVMRLTDLQNDHTSLRIGRATERGIITSAYTTVRPSKETSPFLYLALHSFDVKKGFYGMGAGVRQGLNYGEVKKVLVPVPPLSEQTAIAAYLDEKCATIDAIIAEAKASIEEYKSWKASVIFETVTKGLNPNAEMKGSGVEWIGRVSKGWKIVPAKFFMRVQAGYPFDSERFDNSQGIPLIRIRDITSGHTETFYNGDYPEEYVVHNNDLLVGMDGDFNVRWWQGGEAVLNQRCCRIFARKGLLLRYFYFLLPFYLKQVNELAYSTTVKHLANGDIGNADICLPPEDEQTAIAAYLDSKCAAIDGIILEKEELIKELENYRRSLIFEVVTGKRRVC